MSDYQGQQSAVSRRSAKPYTDQDPQVELGNVSYSSGSSNSSESRYDSADDERGGHETEQRRVRDQCPSGSYAMFLKFASGTGLRRHLVNMFPSTTDDTKKSAIKVLQAAKDHITENAKFGRPQNFGTILPGAVYRSSFPLNEHHEFLQTLGLRTVITLVNKEYPEDFLPFLNTLGVRHIIIDMKGTKKVPIPDHIMRSVIRATLDVENQPVLLHCNHGKHRTGSATAVIRHVAGWDLGDIIEEYTLFAEPKVRDCDIEYITNFDITILDGVFLTPPIESAIAHSRRPFWKKTRFVVAAFILVVIALIVVLFFEQ